MREWDADECGGRLRPIPSRFCMLVASLRVVMLMIIEVREHWNGETVCGGKVYL